MLSYHLISKVENEGEVLRQRFSLGFKINVKTIVI